MNNPKVLVVSHNAFSLTNNMGKTLYGLFNAFDKENIAQLYFHILNPDIDVCKTTFRITDCDVLHSIINPNKCGCIIKINKCSTTTNNQLKNKVYQYGHKRTAGKLLVRDMIWKVGHWKSKDLIKWLDEYSPNVIFFAAGYSMFSFNIALFIADKYNIPLVTYFCDEYYDYDYSSKIWSLNSAVRMNMFRNKIKKVINKSQELVFISQSMMEKYIDLFNKRGHVIMTPYSMYQVDTKKSTIPLVMSFVGNIMNNRWKTLRKIGQALEKINYDGLKIILNIYSTEIDTDITSNLTIGNSIIFRGAADSEMVKKIYFESDIMLHVESFDTNYTDRVRHSISTKIADCLASNRAFLAVGPKGIASIDYLKENNAAYIIEDENMIKEKLIEYFINNDIDDQIINNAKELAKKNHDLEANSEKLKNIFENIFKG